MAPPTCDLQERSLVRCVSCCDNYAAMLRYRSTHSCKLKLFDLSGVNEYLRFVTQSSDSVRFFGSVMSSLK